MKAKELNEKLEAFWILHKSKNGESVEASKDIILNGIRHWIESADELSIIGFEYKFDGHTRPQKAEFHIDGKHDQIQDPD